MRTAEKKMHGRRQTICKYFFSKQIADKAAHAVAINGIRLGEIVPDLLKSIVGHFMNVRQQRFPPARTTARKLQRQKLYTPIFITHKRTVRKLAAAGKRQTIDIYHNTIPFFVAGSTSI